jgi:hypothetical protein
LKTARPHRRLIWKYTAVVTTLVAAAVVSVGLTEPYFAYQDSKRALTRVERDKASSAATSVQQFMQDILREIDSVAQPTTAPICPGARSSSSPGPSSGISGPSISSTTPGPS